MADSWAVSWGASWLASWTRTAYVPISDEDFIAWLEAPNKRCVLAEFSAVGFDSPSGTKTVNVYIANMGFTSASTDSPANQHYNAWIDKIPNFHRELGLALSGKASAGFGGLVVKNPAAASNGPGVRDDWLRMKWKRDFVTLYLGDPSWRKADFRVILKGRLGPPTAPSTGLISFPMADLSDLFNGLLQTNKFDSGPNEGRYKPLAIGAPNFVDLPVLDDTALTFQLHDGELEGWDETTGDGFVARTVLFDNGINMESSISADYDAATNTVFLPGSPTHGFTNDSTYVVAAGAAPGGVDYFKRYYIINVTGTTWQLSETIGGSAVDLTGATGTALATVMPYHIDYATGIVTLTTTPTSARISASPVLPNGDPFAVGFDESAKRIPAMYEYVMFTKGGISEDFKDADSFDDLTDALDPDAGAGLWFGGRDQTTIGAAVERISSGTFTWYGVTPEGLIQVGLLDLPSDTAVMEFTASDVKAGSLLLTSVIRPIDFTQSDVTHSPPNLDNGALLLMSEGVSYAAAEKSYLPNYDYGAGTTPIDDHPELGDSQAPRVFDSIYVADATSLQMHLATFYKKALGVFEFFVPLRALRLNIGSTIQLEHPRLGWKVFDAGDPQSPDNSDEFDATKAVVIGVDVNLSIGDPYKVKLTVFRQIPGYYPEENLN